VPLAADRAGEQVLARLAVAPRRVDGAVADALAELRVCLVITWDRVEPEASVFAGWAQSPVGPAGAVEQGVQFDQVTKGKGVGIAHQALAAGKRLIFFIIFSIFILMIIGIYL